MRKRDTGRSTNREGASGSLPDEIAAVRGDAEQSTVGDSGQSAPALGGAEALMRDIADELSDHLTCGEQDAVRRGASVAQATADARRAFGDPQRMARELFILNGGVWMMVTKFMWFVLAMVMVMFAAVLWHSQRQTAAMRNSLNELNERLTSMQAEPPTGTLILRVVSGPDHDPVPDVKVNMSVSPLKGWNPFSSPDTRSAKSRIFTTDADGRIKLEPVDIGNYSYSINRDPTNKGTNENDAILSFHPNWIASYYGRTRVAKDGEIVECVLDITPPPMRPATILAPEEHEWSDSEKYFVSLYFSTNGDGFRKDVSFSVRDSIVPIELPEGAWSRITITYSFPEWYVRNLNQPQRDSVTYNAVMERKDDGSLILRPTTRWENLKAKKPGS